MVAQIDRKAIKLFHAFWSLSSDTNLTIILSRPSGCVRPPSDRSVLAFLSAWRGNVFVLSRTALVVCTILILLLLVVVTLLLLLPLLLLSVCRVPVDKMKRLTDTEAERHWYTHPPPHPLPPHPHSHTHTPNQRLEVVVQQAAASIH